MFEVSRALVFSAEDLKALGNITDEGRDVQFGGGSHMYIG